MYRVGDDQDVGIGRMLSGGLGEVADDRGVGVEQVCVILTHASFVGSIRSIPSRVMPGLRGTPAGMTTISAPLRASARPEGVASCPVTFCELVRRWWDVLDVASYRALGVDVTNVGSDTCGQRVRA
jgi:hypothetical protein